MEEIDGYIDHYMDVRYKDIDKNQTAVAEGSAESSESVVIKGKMF